MKIILIVILFCISFRLFAPGISQFCIEKADPIKPFEKLWDAICKIESNNDSLAFCIDINNSPSVGIAQIQDCRIRDFNARTGNNYTLDDMFSPAKAKIVFMYYCEGDYEHIAKRWNGRGKQTEIYWQKILKVL